MSSGGNKTYAAEASFNGLTRVRANRKLETTSEMPMIMRNPLP